MMSNKETRCKTYEKFTWKIDNFSKLKSDKVLLSSEAFFLNGYPWWILIYPMGKNEDCFKIYLDVSSLPPSWNQLSYFTLALINQNNGQMTKTYETKHDYNEAGFLYGYSNKFITFRELRDPKGGFIVNDICIIQAEIVVCNSEHERKPNIMFLDENFKGLGKIDKAFVPLLEKAWSMHPSLVESQKRRGSTQMFNEWAFTALGRVLHFLKTKKVRDMINNDDACNQLQVLWDELQTFGFDLTWLKPYVLSALDMKRYNERAAQVKKLRDRVVALKMDLKIATSELVKAEEGFKERALDDDLVYGGL